MSLWTMTDEEAGKPKYLSDELRNEQTVSDKDATIGIDAAEAADADSKAKGLVTPGWVTYTTYTDSNGNTRHKSEVLVAAGSMGSDGTATLSDDLGGGGGATLYTAGTDYGTSQEQMGSLKINSPITAPMLAAIQALQVGDQITAVHMAGTTVFQLTSTFANMMGWRASVTIVSGPGTAGSYLTTLEF